MSTTGADVTRRRLQVALGWLWLLDGLLQAQPFMFTRGFARQVIAAAGQGQPGFVSDPLHWASTVVAAHPLAWNAVFVAIQLLLGVGLLVPRTARLALAASIAWALGVWYLGEGLSGLASGRASLITGAPGSALVLALLAGAAWPRRDGGREGPAPWLPVAWAVVWVGAAVLQAMPGQESFNAAHDGVVPVALLVAAEYLIGVGALARRTRLPAIALGLVLTLAFWVLGQDLGRLDSGQATDPNVGPVLALMAIALLVAPGLSLRAGRPRRRRAAAAGR
ncbi:MAG: hypothetical protein QOC68_2496 [Solirubrobacteraceae bacterium]|jgi:hypothetical protein|nr:hypothetical protein [Solirubrobacteraceae bacterium]